MISIGYTGHELQILIDLEGIGKLKKVLSLLEEKKDTHFHLMTPAWGGYELSESILVTENLSIRYFSNGYPKNKNLIIKWKIKNMLPIMRSIM